MGLIRKALRVATLPAGPLGVSGSSKKQRTAKRTANAAEEQARLLRDIREGLGDATSTVAEEKREVIKRELMDARMEHVRELRLARKARRRGDKDAADEHDLMAILWKEEAASLRAALQHRSY